MKRPNFNAARVAGVTTAMESNNTAVKLFDPKGNELTVNFAPPVRTMLAQLLLTRPPVGEPGEALEAGVRLRAQNFAIFEHRGETVLEFLLAPQQSIHIALQGLQADTLASLLLQPQQKRSRTDTAH